MAATSALGFGGGFGQGLASVLMQRREQEREDDRLKEEVKFREFQTMFPLRFQMFQENPTPEGATALQDWVVGYMPSLKKDIKEKGFSFEMLAPLFSQPTKQTEMNEAGLPREVEGPPTLPATSGAAVMRPSDPTFFGMPVLSQEQRAEREGTQLAGRTIAQQRLLATAAQELHNRDPKAYPTVQDALMALGVETPQKRGTTEPFTGAVKGTVNGKPAFGVVNQVTGRVSDPNTGEPLTNFIPEIAGAAGRDTEFGQYYTDWLKDRGKTEEQGTAADRLAARKEFLGAGQRQGMTPGQEATFTRQLRQDRVRETAAAADAVRQVRNMQLALADVKAGRRIAGDQTIISQFNRIIEPDSVTMVSEYARTPQGAALVDRITESFNRIVQGGSGVKPEQLAEMVALAERFAQNQVAYANDVSGEIESIAKEFGIKPELVGREFAMPGEKAPAKAAPKPAITLDTPVFIGPDGKPSLTPPGRP